VRAGVEQRFNQNPYGGTDVYVGPSGSVNFNYALGKDTTVGLLAQYGTTASGFSNYTQAQQFILGLNAAHQFTRRIGANAFFNYQNNFYDQPGSDGAAPDFYDNIFNAGLNASFLVYRNLSLLAGYSFTTLLSTDTVIERDYTQNIVYVGAIGSSDRYSTSRSSGVTTSRNGRRSGRSVRRVTVRARRCCWRGSRSFAGGSRAGLRSRVIC
jgi:hypothetical protein